MKIGVRAHDYGRMEIERLAEALHNAGYQAAQLALPKAVAEISSFEEITAGDLEKVRRAFEKWKIEIPVFGCYMDIGNPDKEIREAAVKTLCRCLSHAKEIGANTVGTETACSRLGKEEQRIWYPCMVDSIKRIMDEAVRLDVKLAIEPVYLHPLADLEAVLDVMEQIGDEAHLRMIFDPANVLEFPEKTEQGAYWTKWLENTGRYIEAMHIKDFYFDKDRSYRPVSLGKGVMDYTAISALLRENRPDMYLLREEMDPENAAADIRFMKEL